MEILLAFLNGVHSLSEDLTDYLKQHVRIKEIYKKDMLLKAGHVCRHIYFIEKGLLRCFYHKGNSEISSWFMKEGDLMVSIESFYRQKESYESIQALEDCTLHYVDYNELHYIYKTFPEFNYIGRELTQHYHILWTQQLYGLRMQTSQERYDWLLQHHSELILRVHAKHLASYLGITEVTLSKIKSR
jgi:CRP-like cAMP-binding protein